MHAELKIFLFSFFLLASLQVSALEQVKFGTNWVPQGEHGGFYQAIANHYYAECGLDVAIIPGGPNVNNRALLLAGRIDFMLDGNLLQSFNAVKQNVPIKAIAAIFQREPQIIMTHPNQGLDSWESLKKAEILYIANGGYHSFFQWMKSIGFQEQQRRPYHYNSAPFIANLQSGQQGYVTAEPLIIEKTAGFKPNIFLLADYGFDTYSSLITTMQSTMNKRPDTVQCMVNGSIKGWYSFLYGNPEPAFKLIQQANPTMSETKLRFAIKQMKHYQLVDYGHSLTLGLGALSEQNIEKFFQLMVSAGIVEPELDFRLAYTTAFVNLGYGLEFKQQLLSP